STGWATGTPMRLFEVLARKVIAVTSRTTNTPPPTSVHRTRALAEGGYSCGMPQPPGAQAPGRTRRARRCAASPAVSFGHGVVDIMLGGLPPRNGRRKR